MQRIRAISRRELTFICSFTAAEKEDVREGSRRGRNMARHHRASPRHSSVVVAALMTEHGGAGLAETYNHRLPAQDRA